MRPLPSFARRRSDDPSRFHSETGAALVELAVALFLLLLIMVATIDFARVYYDAMSLTEAARAGAQYGAANIPQSGDTAGMQTTATNAATQTGLTGVTATASRSCMCATDSGVFTATSPANNCAAACSGGGHIVAVVTVTASKTFSTIANFPGIPSSLSLNRAATLRVTP